MNLTEPKNITFRPIYLILAVLLVVFVGAGVFGRNYHKTSLERIKQSYKETIKSNSERITKDSIFIVKLVSEREKEKSYSDSLIAQNKLFKNQSYINYKKWQNAQNDNYSNSNNVERKKLFTDLIEE